MSPTRRGQGGAAPYGIAAYRAAAPQSAAANVLRLLEEVLKHIEDAQSHDTARRIAEELSSVQSAAVILQGLRGMLDKSQGPLAERLGQTYTSLITALHRVCSLVDSQSQYVRLYMAVLDLRNAWASVVGVAYASAPDSIASLHAQGVITGAEVLDTPQA